MLFYKTEYIFFYLMQYSLLCLLNGRVNSFDPAEEAHTCNISILRLKQCISEFETSLACIVTSYPATQV